MNVTVWLGLAEPVCEPAPHIFARNVFNFIHAELLFAGYNPRSPFFSGTRHDCSQRGVTILSTSDSLTRKPVEAWKWGVVWAMFLATMLNYMDRQTMGSTAKFIKDEFKLNEEGYGNLEFWFGISFTFMQLAAGAMADRLNLKWIYAGAVVLWSAAGFLTGMVETVFALYMCRMMLGVGESFNWVCAGGVTQRIIPRESRGLANAIWHGGASVGAACTPLLALVIVGANGENWRHLFMVVGAGGLIWIVVWLALLTGNRGKMISSEGAKETQLKEWMEDRNLNSKADPNALPAEPVKEVSFFKVMFYRTFIITLLFGLGVNIIWHFSRAWLPRILDRELHLNSQQINYCLAIFFVAADLGGIAVGWIVRKLASAGMPLERARTIMIFILSGFCALFGLAPLASSLEMSMLLFCIVGIGAMGSFSCYFAMSQEISGPHTSRCLGLLGALIWLFLSLMHPQVGKYVDRVGSFKDLMWVIGFVPLIGAFIALGWPKNKEVTPA